MGVGDFVRGAVGGMMIARPSDGHNHIAATYKLGHPPVFAQLTVGADEAVVFRSMGMVLGTLGPGRHSLSPTGTPFLESTKTTDQQRYECEIIFVRTGGTRLSLEGSIGQLTDASGQAVEFFILGTATVGTSNPVAVVTQAMGVGRAGDGVDGMVRERIMQGVSSKMSSVLEQGLAVPTQPASFGPALISAGRGDQLGVRALGLEMRGLEISKLASHQNRPPAGREAAERRAEVAAAEDLPEHESCRFGATRIPFWDTQFEMMVHVSVVGFFMGERIAPKHEEASKDTIRQAIVRAASTWTGTVLDLPGKKDEWGRYVTQVVAPSITHHAGVRGRVVIEGVQIDGQEEAELKRRRGALLNRR